MANKKCKSCGKDLDRVGVRCIACNEKMKDGIRKLRENRIIDLQCPECGRDMDRVGDDVYLCSRCKDLKAEGKQAREEDRLKHGECIVCGEVHDTVHKVTGGKTVICRDCINRIKRLMVRR